MDVLNVAYKADYGDVVILRSCVELPDNLDQF
jgi:hypothetical protein